MPEHRTVIVDDRLVFFTGNNVFGWFLLMKKPHVSKKLLVDVDNFCRGKTVEVG
jgi:hypothetical protein